MFELIAAKADVAHGEWLPMLAWIGIDRQTAHRFMGIGRNPAITNVGNYESLHACQVESSEGMQKSRDPGVHAGWRRFQVGAPGGT
ncbi:MAG: hypothetical protein ACTH08_02525 [Brevibacterium yomogidense]|uniref:hypothetical protein n=1 Tax=Brevibacterium sp. Mu109 TaxID=1255669 RepID=UPI0011AF31EC|nr:hypothetical protein [Brevibacterium sp. Mu109]